MLSEISLHIFLCVQHKVEDFMTTLLLPTLLTLPLTINPLALHSQLPFLSPSLPPSLLPFLTVPRSLKRWYSLTWLSSNTMERVCGVSLFSPLKMKLRSPLCHRISVKSPSVVSSLCVCVEGGGVELLWYEVIHMLTSHSSLTCKSCRRQMEGALRETELQTKAEHKYH